MVYFADTRVSNAAVATNVAIEATTTCEFYNETMCNKSMESSKTQGCKGIEKCDASTEGKRNHCFVLWRKDSEGNINISLKV